MDAEKLAMQRRIDTMDRLANRLYAALAGAEREIARLTAELETVKRERDAACLKNRSIETMHLYNEGWDE